jgi:hypothetical protein
MSEKKENKRKIIKKEEESEEEETKGSSDEDDSKKKKKKKQKKTKKTEDPVAQESKKKGKDVDKKDQEMHDTNHALNISNSKTGSKPPEAQNTTAMDDTPIQAPIVQKQYQRSDTPIIKSNFSQFAIPSDSTGNTTTIGQMFTGVGSKSAEKQVSFPQQHPQSKYNQQQYEQNIYKTPDSMDMDDHYRPLVVYLCTNHGTTSDKVLRPASIIIAANEDEAYQLMEAKLAEFSYPGMRKHKYSLFQVNMFQPNIYMMTMEELNPKKKNGTYENEPLPVFISTNHPHIPPYGAATVILAHNHEEAKNFLDNKLKLKNLPVTDVYTITEFDTTQKCAQILYHGDFR